MKNYLALKSIILCFASILLTDFRDQAKLFIIFDNVSRIYEFHNVFLIIMKTCLLLWDRKDMILLLIISCLGRLTTSPSNLGKRKSWATLLVVNIFLLTRTCLSRKKINSLVTVVKV